MSSSDSDSDESSEVQPQVQAKPVAPVAADSSDSDSDSEESSEAPAAQPAKPAPVAAAESSESDSDSDDSETPAAKPAAVPVQAASDSDSDSEESSEEQAAPAPVKPVVQAADSDSDSDSSSEEAAAPVQAAPAPQDSDDDSDSSSEEEVAAPVPVKAAPATGADSSDDSDSSSDEPAAAPVVAKAAAVASDSDSESSSDEEAVEPAKPVAPAATAGGDDSSSDSDEDAAPVAEVAAEPEAKQVKKWEPKAKKTPAFVYSGDDRNKPRNAHLQGKTNRCFVGNCSYDIDDDAAKEFFKDVGVPTDIYWLTDRESGQFKGAGFISFESNEIATAAVALAGVECMGRPMKVDWSEPRKPRAGGAAGGSKGSFADKPISAKPEGCTTCFIGNLDFNITEETIRETFKDCGSISRVRWVEKDGQFKGFGFLQFYETAATDEAVKINGTKVMGRPIRVDFAADRKQNQQKYGENWACPKCSYDNWAKNEECKDCGEANPKGAAGGGSAGSGAPAPVGELKPSANRTVFGKKKGKKRKLDEPAVETPVAEEEPAKKKKKKTKKDKKRKLAEAAEAPEEPAKKKKKKSKKSKAVEAAPVDTSAKKKKKKKKKKSKM